MSWHCSRALVAGFLAESSSGGVLSAPLSTTPMPETYYWPDKTTEHSRLSRYGMTCEPLMAEHGEALLTWFREASLAKTLVPPAVVTDWTVSEVGYGRKWLGLFARFSPDTLSWKTPQCSLLEGWDEFSETWPKWGSMRNGESWERQSWERPIAASEFGLSLPTPTASDHKRTPMKMDYAIRPETQGVPDDLAKWAVRRSGLEHARLEPSLWEWAMGWPEMWTRLKPLETGKFQSWLLLHGAPSHV